MHEKLMLKKILAMLTGNRSTVRWATREEIDAVDEAAFDLIPNGHHKIIVNEHDRGRKAREQYEAMQAHQKRVQEARERLQKRGLLLKVSIVLGGCLIIGLGFLDPIFKLLGFAPH
jgi:hypothetical protein